MLDRYLVASGSALDLATGSPIRWHKRADCGRPMPPLFTMRGKSWLIDFEVRGKTRLEIWERAGTWTLSSHSSITPSPASRAKHHLAPVRDPSARKTGHRAVGRQATASARGA